MPYVEVFSCPAEPQLKVGNRASGTPKTLGGGSPGTISAVSCPSGHGHKDRRAIVEISFKAFSGGRSALETEALAKAAQIFPPPQ